MDDLVQWLRAQIMEIRQIALAVPPDMRTREWSHPGRWIMDGDPGGDQSNAIAWVQHGGRIGELIAEHIGTHSPRDALAQCEAHAGLLDLLVLVLGADRRMDGVRNQGLRALALAYQHRPGYREEWRP